MSKWTGWVYGNNYKKRGRVLKSKGSEQGEPWYETEDGMKWSSFDVRFRPDQPLLLEWCRGCEMLMRHCLCGCLSDPANVYFTTEQDYFGLRWDRWVGTVDQVPTMLIKHLYHRNGRRIDLHCFLQADPAGCYHTHPAKAVRVVLWGGYQEESVMVGYSVHNAQPVSFIPSFRMLLPGFVGRIEPDFCHRIDSLRNGRVSYSLWFRGPVSHKVKLIGPGWPPNTKPYDEDLDERKNLA